MLLFLGTAFFTLVKVDTAPTRYDQRQEGDFNLHAKLENLLFVVAIPNNNDLLADLALQALEFKQLASRSSLLTEQESIKSDEETRGVEPYPVEIIQINENHSNKGSSVQKTEGQNKETTNVSNQQTIFSISNEQDKLGGSSERVAKNVKAFEFPKSREEPAIIGYFVDMRKMFGSKIEDEGRVRNVVENVSHPDIESRRPGTILRKQLLRREDDVALPPSNIDKNDVTSLSENKRRDELVLLGDGIENCGPGRYRDSAGLCQDDESDSAV